MSVSLDCQRILVKAITGNNGDLARQLFKTNGWLKEDLSLYGLIQKENVTMSQVKSQCPLIASAYIPDNAWCFAAVLDARRVMKTMREFGVRLSESNSHRNNALHCIIARASIEADEYELKSISTIYFIKRLATQKEYTELLLAENDDGLRPLELASHLGTFSLFQFIFETSELYVSRIRDFTLFSVMYFDITDYIIGRRMLKSPPFTILLLDQNSMNHKSLPDVLFKDPMKTWIAAIDYSNRPYIIVFAFLRIIYIFNFLLSLHFTAIHFISRQKIQMQHMHQGKAYNLSTPVSGREKGSGNTHNPVLLVSLMFSIIYSVGALLINIAYLIDDVCHTRKMPWKTKTASGNKDLVVYKRFYMFANWINVIVILVLSQDVLRPRYIHPHYKLFSAD